MIAIVESQNSKIFKIVIDDDLLADVTLDQYNVEGKICGLFSKDMIVPDAWRYDLKYEFGEIKITVGRKELNASEFPDKPPSKVKGKKIIILLLESPHKKEFALHDGKITPKAPAQGKSPGDAGGAIERYLPLILAKSTILPGEYSVIISNPVPYHASLGHFRKGALNKKLRDHVWQNIWAIKDIQDLFMQRLKIYNPTLILNCCTANLTKHINCFLSEHGYENKTFVVPHPAVNWNINKSETEVMNLKKWRLANGFTCPKDRQGLP